MPAKDIQVTWDDQHKRFIVRCPIWANDVLNDLPSKRWSKALRAWGVAPVRANIEVLEKIRHLADWAEDATERSKALRRKYETMGKQKGGMPTWYPYKTKPRPFQKTGQDKLYGLAAFALHMDRGTGKSKTVIDIACARRMEGVIDAVLVICRVSLRRNWEGYDRGTGPGEREGFIGHAPIPCSIHMPDTTKLRQYEQWMKRKADFRVLIVGTESLSAGGMIKIAESFMRTAGKVMIVVDEAHDIANAKAIRTQRVWDLGRESEYRATLTGSPVTTGPLNLYSQFEFLDPDIIGCGDYYAFRNRYAVMGGYRPKEGPMRGKPVQVVGYQNMDELAKLVAPYVYEVRKADVLSHLPPKSYEKRYVTMSDAQIKLYREVKKDQKYKHGDIEQVIKNTLTLALRLHQVAGGWITTQHEGIRKRADGSEKVFKWSDWHEVVPQAKNPKIVEVLDIAQQDCQQIIWCAYRVEVEAVIAALEKDGKTVRPIHGGVSESDRSTFKDEFQSGKVQFLVGNTATGGTGLTLTAAEIMTYFNNTEKMVDREQSEDRAHREGLQHPVHYIDLIAEKTVDETIVLSIADKVDLAEYVRRNIRAQSDLLGDV